MNESSSDLLVVGEVSPGSPPAPGRQHRARVTLVEKGAQVGGSTAFGGFVWTAASYAAMREAIRDGDPELGRRLVEGIGPGLD